MVYDKNNILMVYMRIHEQDSLEGIYVTDWQGVIIMPTILVDYENVNGSNGLKGTDELSRDETLINNALDFYIAAEC